MQTRTGGAEARASTLRAPEIAIGALRLKRVGILGISPDVPPFPAVPGGGVTSGTFFDWYSQKAPERVIGWLGGNVLKAFRLTIDYPRRMIYWERQTASDVHDLDQVGITLETRDDAQGYFVAGIAEQDGKPTARGLRVGDRLVEVDHRRVSGATRGAIFGALHGKAGTLRTLVVEREGNPVTVRARTTAF